MIWLYIVQALCMGRGKATSKLAPYEPCASMRAIVLLIIPQQPHLQYQVLSYMYI